MKKNILTENMKRFGTKNLNHLNEQAQQTGQLFSRTWPSGRALNYYIGAPYERYESVRVKDSDFDTISRIFGTPQSTIEIKKRTFTPRDTNINITQESTKHNFQWFKKTLLGTDNRKSKQPDMIINQLNVFTKFGKTSADRDSDGKLKPLYIDIDSWFDTAFKKTGPGTLSDFFNVYLRKGGAKRSGTIFQMPSSPYNVADENGTVINDKGIEGFKNWLKGWIVNAFKAKGVVIKPTSERPAFGFREDGSYIGGSIFDILAKGGGRKDSKLRPSTWLENSNRMEGIARQSSGTATLYSDLRGKMIKVSQKQSQFGYGIYDAMIDRVEVNMSIFGRKGDANIRFSVTAKPYAGGDNFDEPRAVVTIVVTPEGNITYNKPLRPLRKDNPINIDAYIEKVKEMLAPNLKEMIQQTKNEIEKESRKLKKGYRI